MRKKSLKSLLLVSLFVFSCFCLAACGSSDDDYSADEIENTANQNSTATDNNTSTTKDQNGTTVYDDMDRNDSTDSQTNDDMNNGGLGEGIKDAGEDILDGAEDILDGSTEEKQDNTGNSTEKDQKR